MKTPKKLTNPQFKLTNENVSMTNRLIIIIRMRKNVYIEWQSVRTYQFCGGQSSSSPDSFNLNRLK